jgi:hypothetical protein
MQYVLVILTNVTQVCMSDQVWAKLDTLSDSAEGETL